MNNYSNYIYQNQNPSRQTTPVGYRDNNLSRNIPINKNTSESILNGEYINGSYQQRLNPVPFIATDFKQAYAPNKPILKKKNYSNPDTFLVNNINEKVLKENLTEYIVHIDSYNRPLKTHLDPFSFNVTFSNKTAYSFNSQGTKEYNDLYIEKDLENVKYVKVQSIIFPQFTDVVETLVPGVYAVDPDSNVLEDRFVIMDIPELSNDVYSTNQISGGNGKPFCIALKNTKLSDKYFIADCSYGMKIYKDSQLGKISKLNIKFFDSFGKQIVFDNKYKYDELSGKLETDIRHPLNKRFQVHITLAIGIVDCIVNNKTHYEK